jgi:hypothetical protein
VNAAAQEIAMERDIKDVIGILMRVLDGCEISHEDLNDLGFEAADELEVTLNEAYVKLREFANDRDLRRNDAKRDRSMRSELQDCLDNIVKACDPARSAFRS